MGRDAGLAWLVVTCENVKRAGFLFRVWIWTQGSFSYITVGERTAVDLFFGVGLANVQISYITVRESASSLGNQANHASNIYYLIRKEPHHEMLLG